MAEVVIDLGDTWATPVPEQAAPPRGRVDRRMWLMLLVLVLVLVATRGARPATALRQVAAVAVAGTQVFTISGSALEVIERTGGDASTISSYSLASGAPRWRTTIPGAATDLIPVPGTGILLAVNDLQPEQVSPDANTVALDEATGRLLWTRPGAQVVDVLPKPGRVVLSTGKDMVATQVFSIDLRVGKQAWSLPLGGASTRWAFAGGAAGRLFALVDDTVTLVDEVSGAVVGSAPVGIPSSDDRRDNRAPRLYLIDGRGIVAYEDKFHTVYTAYDLTTPAARWRTTMPTETSFLAGCGPVLCAGTGVLDTCFPVRCSAIHEFLYGLDPGTGQQRWTNRGWSHTGAFLGGGDRVVAFNREPTGSFLAHAAVIDATTGQVAIDLGPWFPVVPAPGTPTVVVALRDDSLHTWFGLLNDGIVPLGRLPVAGEACQTTNAYLVCPTLDGHLTVWRYGVGG
jgi:outer membrane protein assembly factor BamB